MQGTPAVKDLVLVGGGHAHLSVLRHFGMHALPGIRLTLVSRTSQSPYSGMLPGLIAGHYTPRHMHFDLRALAHHARARFILAEVTGLDPVRRQLHFADRPPLEYDFLSLNTGSTPGLPAQVLAPARFTPVKPIDAFAERWQALEARALQTPGPYRIGVVGGGAGGLELVLAAHHRLRERKRALGGAPETLAFSLITATEALLPTHGARARESFLRILAQRGIALHSGEQVTEVHAGGVRCASGRIFELDEVLWVTSAAPAPWLRGSGLAGDAEGYVLVGTDLRSRSHPEVFAAGDCAAVEGHPRPKSGVHAVRHGSLLAVNLQRVLEGRPLRRRQPQTTALAILATGPRHAVATRGRWSVAGRWVWYWKDWIDQSFMRRFQRLPARMAEAKPRPLPARLRTELAGLGPLEGRCGGCGAKVAAQTLRQALASLASSDAVWDDGAVSAVPAGQLAVQSIDGFRSFTGDPWLFGRITAAHALSDLHAMGATPHSALAYVSLPVNAEALTRRDLIQMLHGARGLLAAAGATLVGGHTAEGAEMTLALSVTGFAAAEKLWPKRSPQPGDALILTKALGTGVLLAADMQGMTFSPWLDQALSAMAQDNGRAAAVLRGFTVHAVTDVTGFGLAGHLAEMLEGSQLSATLSLDSLPVLPGACEMVAAGIRSSLHHRNERLPATVVVPAIEADPVRGALLFDPQTSGGLLVALPAAEALACCTALHAAGVGAATCIGEVARG